MRSIYLLFFTLFFGLSCKPTVEAPSSPDQTISIDEARKWYVDNIEHLESMSRSKDHSDQDRNLIWERAQIVTNRVGVCGVLVPLNYSSNGRFRLKIKDDSGFIEDFPLYQQALFYKDKNGLTSVKLAQYVNLNHINSWKNLKEFNGWVIHTSWDGMPINAERWEQGKITQSLKPVKRNASARISVCHAVDMGYDYSYVDKEGTFTVVHHHNWQWVGCGGNPDDEDYDPVNEGGGGGQPNGWPVDFMVMRINNIDDVIKNIQSYLKCFNTNSAAKITIYVDQPTANSNTAWSGSINSPDVGHTFISITQGNITRVFGFYPANGVNPFYPSSPSSLVNDSNHPYDVSLTLQINGSNLSNVLTTVKNLNSTYNLNSYNCTDFGQAIMNSAGVHLNSPEGTWPGGAGHNPGSLGQYIRTAQINSGSAVKNTTGGNAPSNVGGCN